jgi:GNAT superfamily N-acetyltransferase
MSGLSGGLIRHRQRFWTPVAGTGVPEQRQRATGESTRQSTGVRGLRRRREKDVAACARLLRVVHYESHYPEEIDAPRAWLSHDDVLDAWVVERQDEILGHVAISHVGGDGTSAYRWREMTGRERTELAAVSRLFVRPKARRTGLGKALLDAAVAEIRARGLVPVVRVVDSHADAVRLVEQSGWRLLSIDESGTRAEHVRVRCYAGPPA